MSYQTEFGNVEQFFYFRSGIRAEGLARCQFGMLDGQCGALLTYPLADYSWRYAIGRSYELDIPLDIQKKMILEVFDIKNNYPEECLSIDEIYSDSTEAANGVTRERKSHVAIHQMLLLGKENKVLANCYMREDSIILKSSLAYRTIMKALKPFETIKEQSQKKQLRKLP